MKRAQHKQLGFGAVQMAVIVLAVLGVVGLAGWQVYLRGYHPVNGGHPSEATHSPGLVTYCSAVGGICFKYPQTWQKHEVTGASPQATVVSIENPAGTVVVSYTPSVGGFGGSCKPNTCFFTAQSIDAVATTNSVGLTVVKGLYTNRASGSILADYFLGSETILAPYHLAIGKTVDVGYFAALFRSPTGGSNFEEFRVKNIPDKSFASEADASAWLSSADVTIAGQILHSVTVRKG